MKKYINIIGKILMVSCMALSLLLSSMYSISVYAGEDYFSSDYTYTVRIYSGGQGTFSDGSSMILIKATPGTTISLTDTLDSIIKKTIVVSLLKVNIIPKELERVEKITIQLIL